MLTISSVNTASVTTDEGRNATSVLEGLGAEAEAMLAEWREWDPTKATNATGTDEVRLLFMTPTTPPPAQHFSTGETVTSKRKRTSCHSASHFCLG